MPDITGQLSLEDIDTDYQAFVDKFKPKKTTDDCYTPEIVYNAIRDYVIDYYGIDKDAPVIRPFWPGGDYLKEKYPEGCVVIDNPPFSIISRICRDYKAAGIRFFLFCPSLTCFNGASEGLTYVITDTEITYENGALVRTAFVTNMTPEIIARTDPELCRIIREADAKNLLTTKQKAELPKYTYPSCVMTAAMLQYLCRHGIEFEVEAKDAYFTRTLDAQRPFGKSIFGAGFLLSDEAAAEKAAAEKAAAWVWKISDRERAIIDKLGK